MLVDLIHKRLKLRQELEATEERAERLRESIEFISRRLEAYESQVEDDT